MLEKVQSKPDFISMEHRILDFWKVEKIFEKLRARNGGRKRYSFLDGPITANSVHGMGIHHAWGRVYKDIFQRYKASQGYDTRYQNGYDCQGLWVEVEVEKTLGFNSKKDIETFGIDNFVNRCKERVLGVAKKIDAQSIRLGYWMDWDNSYLTMSEENNYCIWHFLEQCFEKGWIYRGHDVMPWCPRCGCAISDHEIATEGYKELEHLGVTLQFPIEGRNGEYLMVWTTTPWTLTSNTACAVHPEIKYAKVGVGEKTYYMAKATVESILKDDYEILEELTGDKLVGLQYRGPFDELDAQKGVLHRVIVWEDISESEGTGIVHIAPGCGKEDFQLGKEFDVPAIAPLDENGTYIDGFNWLTGRNVSDVTDDILNDLEKKGVLYRVAPYVHRYPVCWRCDTELVFRLVDEWFISMDELRYDIMEVARKITWMPSFGLKLELDWLRNMEDWCISKKRYWGLALPIYLCECGHFEVIGSREELRERAVEGWDRFDGHTPHRPWIDDVKIACGKCGKTVSRIPDVGNPWLDAGIVPYSTMGYRENREYWEKWFPPEFITECFIGQFRNWFYSLLAMSTVLENREPFQRVLGHALVLDENGEEMHKTKGNTIWFDEAVEKMGADVIRWIFASRNPFNNLNFGYSLGDEVRRRFLTLWNSYSFFVTYATLDRITIAELSLEKHTLTDLDRWILARLHQTIDRSISEMDKYNIQGLVRECDSFIEDLSNWYIRRSRRRFWKSESDEDKLTAYATLYNVLTSLTRLMAPVLPFLCEEIYRNIVRGLDPDAPESIHLTPYPTCDESMLDDALVEGTRVVIRAVSMARSLRNEAQIKIRQPLEELYIIPKEDWEREAIEQFSDQVMEELNVRNISFIENQSLLLEYDLKPDFKIMGKKYGALMPKIKDAIDSISPGEAKEIVDRGGPLEMEIGDEVLRIPLEELSVETKPLAGVRVLTEADFTVALNTIITDDLRNEGLAREFIHKVQEMRKQAGYEISDRIELRYQGSPVMHSAISLHHEHISNEILCLKLDEGEISGDFVRELDINAEAIRVAIEKSAET